VKKGGPAVKPKKKGKKVWMVAVNGGSRSKKAIESVISLMNTKKDRIIILKVVNDNLGGLVPSKDILSAELGGSKEQEDALKFTTEISAELRARKIKHSIKLKDKKSCDVGELLIAQALERNVDYIAIGGRSYPGITRAVSSGSISQHCINNSSCPVLLVHNKVQKKAKEVSSDMG